MLEEVLPAFLSWLEDAAVRATFFVVGEMAERYGEPIRRIAERHEVGSHGLSHERLDRMDAGRRRAEVARSRQVIEAVARRRVEGFRAPYLAPYPGLADDLLAAGYGYDSSGGACAPSPANVLLPKGPGACRRRNGMAWVPISTMRDGLNPFCLTALRVGYPMSVLDLPSRPRVFFLHLHELSDLPVPPAAGGVVRRWLLRRGRGATAWRALRRAVAWYQSLGADWVSCHDLIANPSEEKHRA